jgi:hypothetical protein
MKIEKFINPGTAIMLLLVFWIGKKNFDLTEERSFLSQDNITLTQNQKALKKERGALGDTIAFQRETILSERQARMILEDEYAELKKIKQNTRIISEIDFIEVPVPADTELVFAEIDSSQFLKIPQTFSDSTEHYQISSTVNRLGLQINRFKIPNTTSVSVGLKKQGFLRRPEPVVLVKHSNPYVNTTGMTNITVNYDVPWYNTRLFNVGVGLAVGYAIAK